MLDRVEHAIIDESAVPNLILEKKEPVFSSSFDRFLKYGAIAVVLITLLLLIFLSASKLTPSNNMPNFAVLDLDFVINERTNGLIESLKSAKGSEEIERINKSISIENQKVNEWITNKLPLLCSYPCVIFNKKDIFYSDVTDLNKLIINDLKAKKE